mgnify:CR=1 FL=1
MSLSVDLQDSTALVTGASSGLGNHFARVLARHGARVVVGARRRAPLETLVADIRAAGGEALAVELDVSDTDSVTAAFETAQQRFGPVTVVVNNAGIVSHDTALDTTEDDWDQVLNTNLKGAWLVAQTAARCLVATGTGGSIINIASILALRVAGRAAPYIAAKAGLEHLTRALALEWARYHIRVNAIAPGYIETDLNREFFQSPPGQALIKRIPQRRLGQPEDLDGALLLLASKSSRFITGATLVVDGGHLQSTL